MHLTIKDQIMTLLKNDHLLLMKVYKQPLEQLQLILNFFEGQIRLDSIEKNFIFNHKTQLFVNLVIIRYN